MAAPIASLRTLLASVAALVAFAAVAPSGSAGCAPSETSDLRVCSTPDQPRNTICIEVFTTTVPACAWLENDPDGDGKCYGLRVGVRDIPIGGVCTDPVGPLPPLLEECAAPWTAPPTTGACATLISNGGEANIICVSDGLAAAVCAYNFEPGCLFISAFVYLGPPTEVPLYTLCPP